MEGIGGSKIQNTAEGSKMATLPKNRNDLWEKKFRSSQLLNDDQVRDKFYVNATVSNGDVNSRNRLDEEGF